MPANKAWQRHGCYHLGVEALLALPLLKASLGCQDDWNSLDHFDPTADVRRFFKQLFNLRANYRALNDGFALVQHGNWTHNNYLPYSDGSATERGLWSVSRGGLSPLQNFTLNDTVWLLYANENSTITYSGNYTTDSGVAGPALPIRYCHLQSLISFQEPHPGNPGPAVPDGKAPCFGYIKPITLQSFEYKALVPIGSHPSQLLPNLFPNMMLESK